MIDSVIPLGVLALMLVFVAQIRRLISHAILNQTIRKALAIDPASARLLIEKLEPRPGWSNGLVGWIMVCAGLALGAAGLLGLRDQRAETFQFAIVGIVVGAGILLYAWWVERSTPRP